MPRTSANGVELYYESLGEGRPIVFQGHDHSAWLFFQAPYFAQRYRVVTFDRRGTGRSSAPSGPWSIADLARDLAGLVDALELERPVVVGSSLGGVIAAEFALDFPGRASAFVIGHTVPYLDDLGRAWLEEQIAAAREGRPAIIRQPRSGADEAEGPPTTDPAFAASEVGRLVSSVGTGIGRTPADSAKVLEAFRGWDQRPRYAELERLEVPTLVIVGEREPRTTIDLAREWHQHIPRSEFVVLPGAHHAAHREAPLRWNRAVEAFLARNHL
jgi:pimeloyl-ACP methyl ester carboxylesterase